MSPRILIWALALWPAGASAADWSVSLSGGVTSIGGGEEQPFVSLAGYRYFGSGYVRAGVAWLDGAGEPDVAEPLPANTRQVTVGGGFQAGRVLFDAYATFGSRDFIPPSPSRTNGRIVRDETNGHLYSFGGSVTWDAPAGDKWSVAPFLSASYSILDTVRTLVPLNGDPVIDETRKNGLTGIAGISADRVWPGGSLGIYVAAAATSNRASIDRQGSGLAASRASQLIPAEDEGDTWIEYGLSGAVELGHDWSIDALLVRTAGFSRGETTSASAGLRVRF